MIRSNPFLVWALPLLISIRPAFEMDGFYYPFGVHVRVLIWGWDYSPSPYPI